MKCLSPQLMYMSDDRREVRFSRRGASDEVIFVPCRKCLACVHTMGLAWGHRCWHESLLHDRNAFLTLTYTDAQRPALLESRDLELFFKRLRKWMGKESLGRLRYFAVGEHGDVSHHAHFHVEVFGVDFLEYSERVGYVAAEDDRYLCPKLEELWGYGSVHLSPLVAGRCKYAAMHAVKAFGTPWPTFRRASKSPPIGAEWLRKYHDDFVRNGFGTIDGVKYAVPLHYLAWTAYKQIFEPLKDKRVMHARSQGHEFESDYSVESREVNLRAKLGLNDTARYKV